MDENAICAFFETGNLIAVSHDGQELWSRSLTEDFGAFESTIGLAASPVAWKDSIILLVDHEGPSYLVAIDRKSGETRWKTDRDSRTSYASPAIVPIEGSDHVVCSSSGSVDGYHPETGELLWSLEDVVGGNRATTPLAVGNSKFVIAASPGMHNENEGEARKSNGVVAVTKTDAGFKANVVWRTEEAMPAFNTPTFHNGCAYWVNRAGVIFCYDAETGTKHYAKRIQQGCWATPVAVGDRLYVFGKDGLTSVLASGREFNLLAENQLWNPDEMPSESMARNRAAGRESSESEHKHESTAKAETPDQSTGSTDQSNGATAPSGERPAGRGRPAGGPPGGAAGGYDEQTMAQGENRFADPVQYGVAIVNGNIVIRTGEMLYCVRNLQVEAGGEQ